MKRLAFTVLLALGMGSANAAVLDFDDVVLGGTYVTLNSQDAAYGGFTWDSGWAIGSTSHNANYSNASTSGSQYLSNFGAANNLTITRATAFTFNGAHFLTPTPNNPASSWVNVTAYDAANNLIGSTGNVAVSTSAVWVSANFSGVTKLVITRDNNWFTMDDFTYDAGVPAPAVLGLFALGLAGIGFSRKRK